MAGWPLEIAPRSAPFWSPSLVIVYLFWAFIGVLGGIRHGSTNLTFSFFPCFLRGVRHFRTLVHFSRESRESRRNPAESRGIPRNPVVLTAWNPQESFRIPGNPQESPVISRNPQWLLKNPENLTNSSRTCLETSYKVFEVSSPSAFCLFYAFIGGPKFHDSFRGSWISHTYHRIYFV